MAVRRLELAAVRYRARRELGHRRRAIVGLAALVALVGGLVTAAAAGAARTDSAYPRFVADHQASDVVKIGTLTVDPDGDAVLDRIESLPEVVSATRAAYVFAMPLGTTGRPAPSVNIGQPLVPERGWLQTMDRPKVLAGRRPDPRRPNEISLSYTTARDTGLGLGDHLKMATWTPSQAVAVLTGADVAPGGPVIDLEIVGVDLSPGELAASSTDYSVAHFSPAFYDRYRDEVGLASGSYVRLRHGAADVPAFLREAAAFGARDQGLQAGLTAKTQRATHLPAVALRLFALLAGVAGAVIVFQALARELTYRATDEPTLRAVGMTRLERASASFVLTAVVAAGGAAGAIVLAVILSPLAPIGLARVAEPHPGVAFGGTWLVGGALVIVLVGATLGAIAAWRTSGLAERLETAGGGAHAFAFLDRVGGPPPVAAGLKLGLRSGRGSTAVPIRTTIAGVAVAIAAVVTAMIFVASLDHLLRTPRLYGWDWDITVGSPYSSQDLTPVVRPVLEGDPAVAAFTPVDFAPLLVNGRPVDATAFDDGPLGAQIVEGRAPSRPDELVLGPKTLRRIGVHVGDRVDVRAKGAHRRMQVVGTTVLANLSFSDTYGVGEGAALTFDGLRALDPGAYRKAYVVRLRDPSGAPATIRRLTAAFGAGQVFVQGPVRPPDLDNFRRIERAPITLAGILALLAVVTLGHALLSATRRRAKDLAILKVLGFVRREVRAAVAWQATSLTVIALVVGLPAGVALGRLLWVAFAGELGVVARPVVPTLAVALAVPLAILTANLAAGPPARAAARIPPATVLRRD